VFHSSVVCTCKIADDYIPAQASPGDNHLELRLSCLYTEIRCLARALAVQGYHVRRPARFPNEKGLSVLATPINLAEWTGSRVTCRVGNWSALGGGYAVQRLSLS
jgi:hypothetical protein